ncbi:MAG: M4 family metallopeptidase [Microvirga sp.]
MAKRGSEGTRNARAGGRKRRDAFKPFHLHVTEPEGRKALRTLRNERRKLPAFALNATEAGVLNSETAAIQILQQALDSASLPHFVPPKVGETESGFKSLGVETVLLTGTKFVKFRQHVHGIPVYGSLVAVELDGAYECVSFDANLATPDDCGRLAKVSPLEASRAVAKEAGYRAEEPPATPTLTYYLAREGTWHLAYMLECVPLREGRGRPAGAHRHSSLVFDYVVDAMSGRVIAELPRTPTLTVLEERALDASGRPRRFRVTEVDGTKRLYDPALNVETYDFGFRDCRGERDKLPGRPCTEPWKPAAVSAHANGTVVARFLREVLKRNNIDNRGGRLISVVNCIVNDDEELGRIWPNALWDGTRMIYGQALYGRKLRSFATILDIVAHELFHGVIGSTARLEYEGETGALNESYCDIFAILISNWKVAGGIGAWNWRLGEGVADELPEGMRDFADPTRFRGGPGHPDEPYPKHWKDYWHLDDDEDKGGVHFNSGIHNYAAYRVMTAKARDGAFLFTPEELAAMFYVALSQHLSRQATFAQSRRAVVLAARSLFRKLSAAELTQRVRAIEHAFSAAGIEEPSQCNPKSCSSTSPPRPRSTPR